MELSIPSDLLQFVDQQVAGGAYATPSEVVGDARGSVRRIVTKMPLKSRELRHAILSVLAAT